MVELMKDKKVKPGQIRFTPIDNRLMEMPPFVNSVSNPPSWFKKIHKNYGSLRTCAGTVDYLATGVTIPLWTNVYCRPRPDGLGWEYGSDEMSPQAGFGVISGFPFESTGSCPMTQVRGIETSDFPKIMNPWRIETAPGWSTMMIPLAWEPNNDYSIVPAVVHTDFYHTMNLVLNITASEEFYIKFGTPMMHLIPFKRSEDFNEVLFNDESHFKYVATKGFGMGHISPRLHTSAPYRKERKKVDEKLAIENKKGKFKDRFTNVFRKFT
jgi:hypothetical protein